MTENVLLKPGDSLVEYLPDYFEKKKKEKQSFKASLQRMYSVGKLVKTNGDYGNPGDIVYYLKNIATTVTIDDIELDLVSNSQVLFIEKK